MRTSLTVNPALSRVVADASASARRAAADALSTPIGRRAARELISLGVSRTYSIGIYAAGEDLRFRPAPGVWNPVLTTASITDAVATTIADPFMIQVDGTWHMFFEVVAWHGIRARGEIGHAISADGLRWEYQRIVLAEPWHLSFPYVFAAGDDIYMVPESWQAGAVRLYRADAFPSRWTFVTELLRGEVLLDACPFQLGDRWWMPVTTSLRNDQLRLFQARKLTGPWTEHARSPIVNRDRRRSRAGGRVLVDGTRVLRFAQDCDGTYGMGVRAFEITRLEDGVYEERDLSPDPLLAGSGSGWNSIGMHHMDVHAVPGGGYVACVDGWADAKLPRRVARGLRRWVRG